MGKKKQKAIPQSDIKQKIEDLAFYLENYIGSAKRTLSFAIPQLVNEVEGSAAGIGKAIGIIEKVERAATRRIRELMCALSERNGKEQQAYNSKAAEPLSPEEELTTTVKRTSDEEQKINH